MAEISLEKETVTDLVVKLHECYLYLEKLSKDMDTTTSNWYKENKGGFADEFVSLQKNWNMNLLTLIQGIDILKTTFFEKANKIVETDELLAAINNI